MYRQEHPVVGRVTFASGEQQEFTDSKALLQAIREELPFRSTTGFRFETLTDDPEVKKAVDDILLDFAGEDNSRRPCNYGLTETGKQALRKAADPSIPHTYAWFVMTDTNTPQEIIRQDLTLEEAIQIYQDSNTSEKRLGVIKDGIATVDFVHFQSGEQQFFTDHEKLESFRSDLVVAEAMERLYQQLNQPDIPSFPTSINFDPDEVFGTNVASAFNDDWLNVYANFDWKTGRIDSALTVCLVCSDGHEFEFSYPLTPAEQVQLWDQMDAYCRQQSGQTLGETRTSLLREQAEEGLEIRL